jgi:hypothetical protein
MHGSRAHLTLVIWLLAGVAGGYFATKAWDEA